jgi:hypothetical protein
MASADELKKIKGLVGRQFAPQNQDGVLWEHEGQSEPFAGCA